MYALWACVFKMENTCDPALQDDFSATVSTLSEEL